MEIVGHFIDYLLDHGKVTAAVLLAAIVVAGAAVRHLLGRLLGRRDSSSGPMAYSSTGGQTTQVSHVRSNGDVTVSPTQRHG